MASTVGTVDVAIIGAGTAGLHAWKAAKAGGARVVLIDRGPWGTTCVRVGCMPSKLLLAAASAARDARHCGDLGVRVDSVVVDGAAVMARLRRERAFFLKGIFDELDQIADHEKIEGEARFIGPTTLKVGDRTIEAKAIVIATGSSSAIPDTLKGVQDRVLTNETVFELNALPKSLAVVGAGPLGIEMAVAFTRLGVRTTVFNTSDGIGGLKDPKVAAAARALMAAELDLKLGVQIKAKLTDEGVAVTWQGQEQSGADTYDRVLVAAGRPPNLKALNLEASGLTLDKHGVPEHDAATLRCGEAPIFIAGDAASDLPVLHEASRQGRLAGHNAADPSSATRETPPTPLSIVFTSPDMARVGHGLKDLGDDGRAGRCDFNAGRARVDNRQGGMIRLYARKTDHCLAGAELVGASVEHLAQLIAVLVQQKLTVEAALALPFYHPTYEEDLQACLKDLQSQLG